MIKLCFKTITIIAALTFSIFAQADDDMDIQLLDAIKAKDSEQAKKIIASGLDLNFDINGSPLILAIQARDQNLVDYILHHGADPQFQGFFFYSPLHLAIHTRSNGIVKSLLKYDIELDERMVGGVGETALLLAAKLGDIELFDMLLTAGADIKKSDNYQDEVLVFAAASGQLEMVKHIVSLKVDLKHSNNNGKTAIDQAKNYGQDAVVAYLESL
ncbi:MAG: ankyrin repeat domain-containing protein [Saccharospirillaceae bacterium]|nr:ankyrin repeat domain-containing protein [Pseudomonadales bacterium]NRB78150.1 ankyrin repeat domain-containing protein [Saccharospirillaceae bacterium]